MNYTLPPVAIVIITNYLFKENYSNNKINLLNCFAVIVGVISSFFIKYGIPIINGIIVTFAISSFVYLKNSSKKE